MIALPRPFRIAVLLAALGVVPPAPAADALNPQSLQKRQHAGIIVHGASQRTVRPIGQSRTVKPIARAHPSSR